MEKMEKKQQETQLPLSGAQQPDAPAAPQEAGQEPTGQEQARAARYVPELCASTIGKLPAQLQPLKACFAQPFDAFRKAFRDPAEADRAMAKEIDFAAQAMMANPFLIQCAAANPADLVNALKNVALTGSTLNPTLKQGYLVPFKGKIQFMPSYMGLVDVLVNNGLVRKVEAHCVFEGDDFQMRLGTGGGLFHQPDCWGRRAPETMKGVYYYAVLADGTELFDTMGRDEVEQIRQRSPSVAKGKQSPWDTDYLEMAKKTALRRAFKLLPKSGISGDKVRAIEAAFAYDEKVEQAWAGQPGRPARADRFDEGEPWADAEEVN